MESGVRGFIMTGDESYLQPTNEVIADIFDHLRQLSASPAITEKQNAQIAQLRKMVDEKSTFTVRAAEVRRQKGAQEAMLFITEGRDKLLMNQIRTITESMLKEADANLVTLKTENREYISHFAITFYLLLLKISITVFTVAFLFYFYFRKRNKSEKVLKESHELFQNVLDHTASVISIKDLSGRFFLINQAYEKLAGTNREDVKGKTAYDLFSKEEADKIRHSDLEVIRLQQQVKSDEIVMRDGEKHHFVSLKFPLFDTNHIPYAICSISTDETEKMETEQQLRDEMNRILDLFNNAPCGYQATDKEGIIVEINETLLKWIGYTRAEVVGKMPVKNLLSPESLHQFSYYFPRIRSGEIKSLFDIEAIYQRKDGTKFAVVVNSIAQYDDDGNFLYTRTSLFDISYRKRVEEVATNN